MMTHARATRLLRRAGAGLAGRLRGRGGFLLLETLVGVTLMAFILSVLPAGVVMSRKTIQKSADIVGARLVVEAVLVNEFSGQNLQPGARSGELDGYQWASMVRPRVDLEKAYKGRGWVPYDVSVAVTIPNGARLKVETLRLGKGR
ncbi:hypothetical protein [Microbaculum marinum]|uniref:Type II secretion system protein n=1 Tax=Microbaculum marinum TaxID=1764581 RepID=A0AAW9RL70_9HYPH